MEFIRTENGASADYQRTRMQKELVLQRLKERGCRITRQRQILLDIILQEEFGSCKEIYYRAAQKDAAIGAATVYRMVTLLEDIGAISRKNMYRISCGTDCGRENACIIELGDETICRLTAAELHKVISLGLREGGYIKEQPVKGVIVEPCKGGCV